MKGDHSDFQRLGDFQEQLRARSGALMSSRQRSCGPGGVFAIFLILAGILLFLDNIGLWHVQDISRYWPLALIAVGVLKLFNTQGAASRGWAAALVIAGGFFLLRNLGVLHVSAGLLWAILLMGVGGLMLARALERRKPFEGAEVSVGDALREWVVFGGAKRRLATQQFQGGELLAVFGGIEIDLRKAGIASGEKEVVIEANATFGGIDIKVPESWSVNVRGVGIFGGYEDKTIPIEPEGAEAPKLRITGYAVFGGVSVQN